MRYSNPHIETTLDLGCLGKHSARVSYDLDDKDIEYVIVDHPPLYLEIEPTTLDSRTLEEIDTAIRLDANIRDAESAQAAADARADAASFERTENFY